MGQEDMQEVSNTDWMGAVLTDLLTDPYSAVRFNAGRSLQSLPGFEDFEYDFVGDRYALGGGRRRALDKLKSLGLPSELEALFENVDSMAIDALRRSRDSRDVHLRE